MYGLMTAKINQIALLWVILCYPALAQSAGLNSEIANFDATPAPSMTTEVSDDQNGMTALATLKGTPILVNFLATWCAPCVAELPALENAAQALAVEGVEVVVISIDRGGAGKAVPFLDKYDVFTPRRLFDPKARLSREMGVQGLPTSFILSADQETSWKFVGPFEWDDPEFLLKLSDLPLHD